MESIDVLEYARKLHSAHGDKAEAEAAQKAAEFEAAGDKDQAEMWRKIRAAIAQARGPRST